MNRVINRNRISLALVVALSLSGAAAACGGTPPVDGQVPANPTASTATFAPSATPTDSSAAPTASTTTTASTAPTTPPPAAIKMKDPTASAMLADLQKIGLDPKNLPSMAKMVKGEKKKLRQVMDLFVKATGMKCKECHDADDFAKDTPEKNVTAHMWDEFSVKLTLSDGSPVFCDSCHSGSTNLLDRTDKKALAKWMQTAYVDKMARHDKKDHACTTCHGPDMNMDLIRDWKKK